MKAAESASKVDWLDWLRWIAIAFLLLVAFVDPSEIGDGFKVLRWIVAVTATVAAWRMRKSAESKREQVQLSALIGIAVIFNPLLPFYFERETWIFIDFAAAGIFAFIESRKPLQAFSVSLVIFLAGILFFQGIHEAEIAIRRNEAIEKHWATREMELSLQRKAALQQAKENAEALMAKREEAEFMSQVKKAEPVPVKKAEIVPEWENEMRQLSAEWQAQRDDRRAGLPVSQ